MNIIEVRNLTKKYNGFTAVNNISFSIAQGETFGFLGPNGAGKTTTINMLTGLANITSGTVKLAGIDYANGLKKAQQLIGIVPDESNLYEELDGFNNLCFCASLYGMRKKEREEKARQLLEQFGLTVAGKKPFKAYSKGMKRKLTIAAGIIHKSKMLFLDEPTTGVDVKSARQIRQLILELNKAGTTIFLTTHYIEEAERLCRRLAFIVDGKIIHRGTIAELMQETQRENIVQFTLAKGFINIQKDMEKQFPGISITLVNDNSVKIHSSLPLDLIPFMKFFVENNLAVYEVKLIRPSLEEVFVKITGIEPENMKKEKEGKKS